MVICEGQSNGWRRRKEVAVWAVCESGDGAFAGRSIAAALALLVLSCRHVWVHTIFGPLLQASDKMPDGTMCTLSSCALPPVQRLVQSRP